MEREDGLLNMHPRIINLGLEMFAETLDKLGVPVVHIDWQPPAGDDQRLLQLLQRLEQRRRT